MTLLTEADAIGEPCIGPDPCGIRYTTEAGRQTRLCSGSRCRMAWRWARDDEQTTEQPPKVAMGPGWVNCGPVSDGDNLWERAGSNRLGYCGIAGRPE